jgi:hypothetical protein
MMTTARERLVAGAEPLVAEALTSSNGDTPDGPPNRTMADLFGDRLAAATVAAVDLAKIPPPAPLIEGLIDLDSLAVLYGPPKQGKSFVAIDWSLSIATGSWWSRRAVEQVPVLYVAAEGVAGLWPRVEAWLRREKQTTPPDQLTFVTIPVNLSAVEQVDALAALGKALGARLVVLDTLARCAVGMEENSSKDMGLVMDQADRLRRATRACILLVHHAGKTEGRGMRGSSALPGVIDTAIECSLEEGVVTVKVELQKHHVVANPIRMRLVASGDAAVLEPHLGGVQGDGLSENALASLDALRTVCAGVSAASASIWRMASGLPDRTFYRLKADLIERQLVVAVNPSSNRATFALTATGTATLLDDGGPL